MRWIRLCTPSIGNNGLDIELSHAFVVGKPQMNTMTQRTIHGVQAAHTSALVCVWPTARRSASCGLTNSESRVVPTMMVFGCQTLRNPARHPIDTSDATTSTSVGP